MIIFGILFLLKLGIDLKFLKLKIDRKFIIHNIFTLILGGIIIFGCNNFASRISFSFLDKTLILIIYLLLMMLVANYQRVKTLKEKNLFNKYLVVIILALVISGIFEITICNFKFFKTLNYHPIVYKQNKLTEVPCINTCYEIDNINKEIKNIYVETNSLDNYSLKIKATDSGNALYYALPTREIAPKVITSRYINLNLRGKSQKIYLEIKNENIQLQKIILNAKVPLCFNSARCLLITFVIFFLYLFKSNSYLFKRKLIASSSKKSIILLLIIFNVAIFAIILNRNLHPFYNDYDYYNQLTESIKHKKVTIEDKNHSEEKLNKMDNPYDSSLREETLGDKSHYLWDAAFYKGHYYVYFGIVPVIMFYLPFNLLFRANLHTTYLIFLCTIATVCLMTLLLYRLVKYKYKNCSIGMFLLLNFLLVYCTGLEHMVKVPEIYCAPIISGLMFTFLGLNIISSILTSQRFIKTKMVLGSLSLALVAGCRPQLLLGSFLMIPILLAFYNQNKAKISKKEYLKYLLCLIIPYLVVGILLMYYNYIRFGSPFDFGAAYNLTTNDMTARGFKLGRIPLGIFVYLFNPLTFQNVFPYLTETHLVTNYMGITVYESVYGGLLATTLIYLVSLFLPKFKKVINSKMIYSSCVIMLISAFIILIFDTQLAGILSRYLTDFAWLFGLVTVIILLAIENKEFKYKDYFHKIVVVLIIMALIYQFFYLFCSSYNYFKNSNLDFWLYLKYLIEFWL